MAKWIKYIFHTYSVGNTTPVYFIKEYPWWESSSNGKVTVMHAWLPAGEDLLKYWPDAHTINSFEHEKIQFDARYQKPSWFIES